MQDLRIAAVQMNCRVAEHDRNLATIERFAEEAAAQDVDIVCFPELCVCGYNAGDTSTPEPEPLEVNRSAGSKRSHATSRSPCWPVFSNGTPAALSIIRRSPAAPRDTSAAIARRTFPIPRSALGATATTCRYSTMQRPATVLRSVTILTSQS